jgi:hypothetical protein
MKLLVDNDAFCKLGAANLLLEAATVLGATLADCGRLPALPYMLRRGGLRRGFGAQTCDALMPLARAMPTAPAGSAVWLDKLVLAQDIDPGEAQLLAASVENGLPFLSADKRALRAVKSVDGLAPAIAGRAVVMEAILLALCDRLGTEEVRGRLATNMGHDTMIQVCFSPANTDPCAALHSYYRSFSAEVEPLLLWNPGLDQNS